MGVAEKHQDVQVQEALTSRPAHALSGEQVADELKTKIDTGLSQDEVNGRLLSHGANVLESEKGVQPLQILIAQIVNAMTLVSF